MKRGRRFPKKWWCQQGLLSFWRRLKVYNQQLRETAEKRRTAKAAANVARERAEQELSRRLREQAKQEEEARPKASEWAFP